MDDDNHAVFPLILKDSSNEYPVKWKVANTTYEAHLSRLDRIESGAVIQHCHQVLHRVRDAVASAAHMGPSLFRVFPRTLSIPLTSIWDQVLADPLHVGQGQNTREDFEVFAKAFVAAHTSPEERYDAVMQLRTYTKPRQVMV